MADFDTIEQSNYLGTPILLYDFMRTSGGVDYHWRYNSSDSDILYATNVYTATAISDDGVKQDTELANSQLNIVMPIEDDFPQMFRGAGGTPSDTVIVTIRRIHMITDPLEAKVFWVGTVTGITQADEVKATLSCDMLLASFKRGGLRLSYTRGCPHALYDPQCTMNPADFIVTRDIVSITGNTIEVTDLSAGGFDSGYFDGGYLEWTLASGLVERRGIKTQVNNTITIQGAAFGMLVGDSLNMYPGCRRTRNVCNDKFSNILNYGGFADMPGKSPFSGDPVF
jgi:uncharacterized phage protein (TIGR02218 family)